MKLVPSTMNLMPDMLFRQVSFHICLQPHNGQNWSLGASHAIVQRQHEHRQQVLPIFVWTIDVDHCEVVLGLKYAKILRKFSKHIDSNYISHFSSPHITPSEQRPHAQRRAKGIRGHGPVISRVAGWQPMQLHVILPSGDFLMHL